MRRGNELFIPSRLAAGLCLLVLCLGAGPARAGVDAPGDLGFEFLADEDQRYQAWLDVPDKAPFSETWTQEVFFSTDASAFGEDGVLIWAGFPLEGDPEGPRYGMLWIDLNLAQTPHDDLTPMPHKAVRAEYLEKRGDTILFSALAEIGDVWIVDIVFHEDDGGALEGDFAFIFIDPANPEAGSRVFKRGLFITQPSPADLLTSLGGDPSDPGDEEYATVDCSGDIYLADDGSGCGGDDSEGGGCEGDTSTESGCEGDSSGGSGCEGDAAGDSCSGCGDAADGCGDAAGSAGACSGAANAAVRPSRIRGAPLRILTRLLPEISALLFITWLRRRNRRV